MANYLDKEELAKEVTEWQRTDIVSARLIELIELLIVNVHRAYCRTVDYDTLYGEVWVLLLRKRDRLRPDENLFSYLTSVVVNKGRKLHAKDKMRVGSSEIGSLDYRTFDNGDTVGENLADHRKSAAAYEPPIEKPKQLPDGVSENAKGLLITIGGTTRTVIQWCEVYGVAWQTAYGRIREGMHPFQAISDKRNHNYLWLEINGQYRRACDVAAENGITMNCVKQRLWKNKMSLLDACTRPLRPKNAILVTVDGETKSVAQWSAMVGLSRHALHMRLHRSKLEPAEYITRLLADRQQPP